MNRRIGSIERNVESPASEGVDAVCAIVHGVYVNCGIAGEMRWYTECGDRNGRRRSMFFRLRACGLLAGVPSPISESGLS
jgi:hypothetical protein